MNEQNKIGYYAIIPANVRYDSELTEKAKLLYGEITCLSNKEGYCFATNSYFAKLYNCTTRAIQNAISKLQERGYIKIVIENNFQRKIFIASSTGDEGNFIGGDEKKFIHGYENNFMGGYEKNITNNNINNNSININKVDRLFNYIMGNEKKIPEEFSEVDHNEIVVALNRYDMLYPKEIVENMSNDNLCKIKEITYVIALIVKNKLFHLTNKVNRDKLIQLYNECINRKYDYAETENQIENFINYYYKSIENELLKD